MMPWKNVQASITAERFRKRRDHFFRIIPVPSHRIQSARIPRDTAILTQVVARSTDICLYFFNQTKQKFKAKTGEIYGLMCPQPLYIYDRPGGLQKLKDESPGCRVGAQLADC